MIFDLFRRPGARRQADGLIDEGNRAEAEGRAAEACALYRQAVAASPGYARAHLNLGVALEALGDAEGAAASHRAALAAEPHNAYAAYNLAKLRLASGAAAEAEGLVALALRSQPRFAEALVLQGCVFSAQGSPAPAAAAFESAMAQGACDFGVFYHHAQALRALERLPEARAMLERALAIDPSNVDARASLADVLAAQGDIAGSVAALETVLDTRPRWADALYNYGCMLRKLQRLPDAEAAFRRAVLAQPDHARAYQMLGGVLLGQGRVAEARDLYTVARRECPDDFALASAELFSLLCDERVADDDFFARHAEFGRRIESRYPARTTAFRNVRDPQRRLRIGYVSGDFCYHVIALQMLGVLTHHDRSAVEVYCYSTTERPDSYTHELQARADVWRAWRSMSDEDMARTIEADGIDILVDLAGHSGISQLAVMACRPAPVQVTWAGYLATTGLTRIDYRLTDAVADAPGATERYHSEALVRLPHSQWCWRPFATVEPAARPPCFDNGYVTFASFHGAMKLSPAVRALWARILARLPDSRMVFLGVPQGRAQEDLVRDLGVSAERVTCGPYVSVQDYMGWFNSADVVLDTLPYSGATTTCDALFMGVPVITVPGTRSASRSAASVLTTLGLHDWIVGDADAYVARAVRAAQELQVLAELRRSLRARLAASPLMDDAAFARGLETAYRRMWKRWCEGRDRVGR
jgi:predicted O-linked N-acetylglucosamine transferase (SPINDLY family)